MSIAVTNTEQLSTFDTIKTIIKTDATLNSRFKDADFLQFEPNYKSRTFGGFPYFYINVPDTTTDAPVYDQKTTIKEFTVDIELVVDYVARDKLLDYTNRTVKVIEGADTTFEAQGYYDTKIEVSDVSPAIIKEKQVVIATFELTLKGRVTR